MRISLKSIIFIVVLSVVMILSAWMGKVYFRPQWDKMNSNDVIQSHPHGHQGFPTIGGPFQLVDQHGQRRTDADFKGKIMLVYFGYTFCPDICPAALVNMTDALTDLGSIAQQIQPLFITIDPERDTVPHLKIYM